MSLHPRITIIAALVLFLGIAVSAAWYFYVSGSTEYTCLECRATFKKRRV